MMGGVVQKKKWTGQRKSTKGRGKDFGATFWGLSRDGMTGRFKHTKKKKILKFIEGKRENMP